MDIQILALDDVFDTGLAALQDTFATANELVQAQGLQTPVFNVRLVGTRKRVRTAMGLAVPVEMCGALPRPDWLVVPALNAKQPDKLIGTLARRDVQDALGVLQAMAANQVHIAAACLGTFLTAEAGLLDGHAATTTWSLAPLFRQRYPAVALQDDRLVCESGRMVTAGAMMGHLDLALWLLRRASPELATLVARFMLIDERPSQAPYIIPDYLAHADPLVMRFERWAKERLAEGFSLPEAASALHVHTRTLQRRMELVLGKSPLSFVQDLRVERAQQLAAQGLAMEAIAGQVGYADASTLRNLIRRKSGKGARTPHKPGR